ncbi:MAG TPA: hypothetical protein VHM65_04735 [Candidatus Lustribacter sp.]|nr:hypothetical protein [Candidatus Lustribacter sp.]
MADVQAAARRAMEREVGRPRITVQPPGGRTLVNFTTIFSAPAQQVRSLPITVPVPGSVTGSPSYAWDLGEGITGQGSGSAYVEGMSPNDGSTDGLYVKARYRQPGLKSVTATLTWEVDFELAGWGAVPLAPIVFTSAAATTAREARNVLVAP